MFDALTKGFRAARQKLTGLAELSEDNIDQALREVRVSLLEADVELGVVKRFLARVREQVLGQVVAVRAEAAGRRVAITPGDVFVKACQDELVAMMSADTDDIHWAPRGQPTVVMMVGLQGQGKTTTAAKLARLYQKEGKRVLLVAADLQRPAAIEQLQVLGRKVGVDVFVAPGANPVETCKRALAVARVQKREVVIFDTAGRLAVDERLMAELQSIKAETKPQNILLVVNAAIGQNALQTAHTFHETLGLTGVALTMLDGDARGGAALAIREVTGVPIRFAGVGEGVDKLEPFRPEGMASRILGLGDVVGLMKDFTDVVDQKQAEKDAMRMLQGNFSFDDFLAQIETIQKMGPLQDLFEKMPFFSDAVPEDVKLDDRELDKVRAMISSMTAQERRQAELFETQPGRVRRVAKGSGRSEAEVTELVAKFTMMRDLMGGIGRQAGMLSKIPGARQLAMARKLKDMVRVQGQDQAISSIAQEMLEAAVAGGPPGAGDPADLLAHLFGDGGGAAGPRTRSAVRDKKNKRKQERQARKKNRRK